MGCTIYCLLMLTVELGEMPTIAAYRLTTNFLRNYFQDKESFARKRAFLEFQLAQNQQAEDLADVADQFPEDVSE